MKSIRDFLFPDNSGYDKLEHYNYMIDYLFGQAIAAGKSPEEAYDIAEDSMIILGYAKPHKNESNVDTPSN